MSTSFYLKIIHVYIILLSWTVKMISRTPVDLWPMIAYGRQMHGIYSVIIDSIDLVDLLENYI